MSYANREFLNYLKPIQYVSILLGTACYTLNENNTTLNEVLQVSLGVPFILGYTFCIYKSMQFIYNDYIVDKYTSKVDMFILTGICIFDFLFTYLISLVQRNKIRIALFGFQKNMLRLFAIAEQRTILIIKVLLLLFFFLWLLYLDFADMSRNTPFYSAIINGGILLNFWVTISYVVVLSEMRNEFCFINGALRQLTVKGKFRRVGYGFDELVDLVQAHMRLSQISRDVCDALAPNILLQITYYFVLLVFGSSVPMKLLFTFEEGNERLLLKWIFIAICCNVLLVFGVAAICYFWQSISNEAKGTALIIHEYWNAYVEEYTGRKTDELELISLELLHGRLSFTTLGFFNLDNTLIHTVIAALVTYLVILIQFNIA